MLGLLRCLVLAHHPDQRRVKKTGAGQYYGYCASCGARIRRLRRNSWKRTRHWPKSAPQTRSE